jgi:hypothetical protein
MYVCVYSYNNAYSLTLIHPESLQVHLWHSLVQKPAKRLDTACILVLNAAEDTHLTQHILMPT